MENHSPGQTRESYLGLVFLLPNFASRWGEVKHAVNYYESSKLEEILADLCEKGIRQMSFSVCTLGFLMF